MAGIRGVEQVKGRQTEGVRGSGEGGPDWEVAGAGEVVDIGGRRPISSSPDSVGQEFPGGGLEEVVDGVSAESFRNTTFAIPALFKKPINEPSCGNINFITAAEILAAAALLLKFAATRTAGRFVPALGAALLLADVAYVGYELIQGKSLINSIGNAA